MLRYALNTGVLVEPVGHLWAAFTPASGESSLLNDECAAILEVLQAGAANSAEVCRLIEPGDESTSVGMQEVIEGCWPRLVDVGAVVVLDDSSAPEH